MTAAKQLNTSKKDMFVLKMLKIKKVILNLTAKKM